MTKGLSETDLQMLASVLDGFGVSLGLSDDAGQLRPLAPEASAAQAGEPGGAPPPSSQMASMRLTDGRLLVFKRRDRRAPPEVAAPRPADEPERRAGAERRNGAAVSDMRFRLLAEHSIDLIVAVDADLAIRYASPATKPMLGCQPAELYGHTLAELFVPEDRAAFIARHFTRTAQRGSNVPDLFRVLRHDGSTLWVEARVASLPPGNGLGDYLVTLRDADQRKRAEDSLGKVNAELSALASTDALTNLPNRRQFDATLHKEWYRALRDGTPLSLLMIDVDRFKPLNDRFGHQTGDAFLALVGQVISDNVRRAGDMAARYGGEEFAVVLPSTAAAGALEIAEVIRRAVAAADTRGIVEGGYPLSVSIGVGAAVALAGGGSASLVHSADAALYQAKRNGRNRVEILR